MPIQPIVIQRRMMELGRIRLGEKGPNGAPKKLSVFRFTSASETLLQAVAAKYGGEVRPWATAPGEGYFEVTTKAAEIDIVLLPVFSDADGEPTYPFSQWFELWSGGGCQRRCDGITEALTGKPCPCDPNERACKPTTRVSCMMPDLPGLGVWRLESHGYNVAAEMPGTIAVLSKAAAEGIRIPAVLRAEQRTKVVGGQTRKYIVPVLDLKGVTVDQIAAGDVPLAINAPPAPAPRPALPAAQELPADTAFVDDIDAEFGAPPEIVEPPKVKKQTAADAKKLKAATDKLAVLEPDIDWPALAEKASAKAYNCTVAQLNHDQIVELTQRMELHAETFAPVSA